MSQHTNMCSELSCSNPAMHPLHFLLPYYFCISCIPYSSCTPCIPCIPCIPYIPCIFCISKCCWLGLTCLLRISCSPHPAPRLPSNPASAMFAQLSFIAGQNLFGHTRWRERVGGLEGTNYSLQWIFHTEANPFPNHCEQI